MKTLIAFALVATSVLSAQQVSQTPPAQLTASAAATGEGPDIRLLHLLDLADASKAASITASPAAVEHSSAEPAAMPVTPAFQSSKELSEISRFPQFHKKVFVAEVSAYTVANIIDGITTVRGVQRGFTEAPFPKGSSELLGQRPGATRYVLTMGAMQTVATIASYRLQHSHSRVLRMIGHSIMAEGIVDHTSGFVNNLMLGNHP